jgi:hypothetical protein
MLLRLTDGTTSIILSESTPIRGATYFPDTPQKRDGEWMPVTETATVTITGTATAIRAAVNTIEGLILEAQQRQETGAGARVFVNYKPVDADATAYRSEVLDGRVVWSSNPGLRHLEYTLPTVQIAVIWTRAPWWEGDEAELAIAASGQSAATGGRTIDNNPAVANWVQAQSTVIAGNLPAPVRIHLINNTGSTQNYRKVMLGVNAFSDPDSLVNFLQGEAKISGGSTVADAESSGGNVLSFTASSSPTTFQWTLPAADMARTKGRRFRLLARMEAAGAIYVRPDIRTSGGVVQWQGDELALTSPLYESWQDLGVVPLLPGGYSAAYGAARLGLSFRGSGIVALDVIQLTSLDSYRHLEMLGSGLPTNNGTAFVHDSIDLQTYLLAGSVRVPVPTTFGGPLMIYPGYHNRIYILHQVNAGLTAGEDDANISLSFSVRLYYRPRRVTV